MKAREGGLGEWLERFGGAPAERVAHPDKAGLFRALVLYALAVEAERPSTVKEFVRKIGNQRVREGVMSIAEQERGRLERRIQLCQQILGLSVMSSQELRSKQTSELEGLLGDLDGRLRQRAK